MCIPFGLYCTAGEDLSSRDFCCKKSFSFEYVPNEEDQRARLLRDFCCGWSTFSLSLSQEGERVGGPPSRDFVGGK